MTSEENRPDDSEIVQTAAKAAEDVIFARFARSDVRDFDVTVSFEDDQLEIDVYLDAEASGEAAEQVADDAVLAARSAVDDLLA